MSNLKDTLSNITGHLKSELASIRTGRAHASLVEDLPIQVYGTTMTLKELAGISAPDPHLILIEPWDKSTIADIEKALRQSQLQLSPAVDESTIRLPVPALTEERRHEYVKLLKQKAEVSREAVRRAREEAIDSVRAKEKNKEISEDEKFRLQKEIQKQVDDVNIEIEKLGQMKEDEVLRI